jgi:hypothetical protein
MRSLSNELSRRARTLLERDGHPSVVNGVVLGRDLQLLELLLIVDEKGTLTVETNTRTTVMVYMESPNGAILHTSPDDVLEGAIHYLSKYMVLDDMANV